MALLLGQGQLFILISLTVCTLPIVSLEYQVPAELKIAWFAPKDTFRGLNASTSVNTFKYALKAISGSHLKGTTLK